MNRGQLILEITSSRATLGMADADGLSCLADAALSLPADSAQWPAALLAAAEPLAAAVAQRRLKNRPTSVLYHSPTQVVEFAAYPIASPTRAIQAAQLAVTDALPYPASSAFCRAAVIGRGRAQKNESLVLVVADHESSVNALANFVAAAGLKLDTATPADAAVAGQLVSCALAEKSGARAWLYVGERASFFFIAADGALVFWRPIALGLQSLLTALTVPIRVRGSDSVIQLDSSAASELLARWGIPDAKDLLLEKPRLLGQQVMPLLQPVLQHYAVELRQSLRFGVSEEQRARLTLFVAGAGARVPGLAKTLGQQLALPAANYVPALKNPSAAAGASHAAIAAIQGRRLLARLNLLPPHVARQRMLAGARRWLWAGAAAALVLVAFDAFRFHSRLLDARQQADQYNEQITYCRAVEATSQRLQAAIAARAQLDQRIQKEVGQYVNVSACLGEISRLTPPGVRLTGISMQCGDQGVVCNIDGYALPTAETSGTSGLETFMAAMSSCPLFANVKLAGVDRQSVEGRAAEHFQITMTAVGLTGGFGTGPRPNTLAAQVREAVR